MPKQYEIKIEQPKKLNIEIVYKTAVCLLFNMDGTWYAELDGEIKRLDQKRHVYVDHKWSKKDSKRLDEQILNLQGIRKRTAKRMRMPSE